MFNVSNKSSGFELDLGTSKVFISRNDVDNKVNFLILDMEQTNNSGREEAIGVEGKASAAEVRALAASLMVVAAQLEDD